MPNNNSSTWRALPNPFLNVTDIIGHVSGRSSDITQLIIGGQSAVILAGAPRIGKTSLIRYLQRPPQAQWSWRNELAQLTNQLELHDIHFVPLDLTPLENIENVDQLLAPFIEQCLRALQQVYPPTTEPVCIDLKGLRDFLRLIERQHPTARYFVMLDAIEHLERPGTRFPLISAAQTPQERGIALLNHCGAIRTLVDLIDEFPNFNVLLSIESLPLPKIVDQFTHVSADLARFTTMTLHTFSKQDTLDLLAQEPENFGHEWATTFNRLGANQVLSPEEQQRVYQQAGTHPYLLQQCCSNTFYFKQEYAVRGKAWSTLEDNDLRPLLELINERLSTFLTHIWKRLQEAIEKSSPETRSNFYGFINSLAHRQPNEEMHAATWDQLGSELRYILYNEGIVRYNPFHPITQYPGAILSQYLTQKASQYSPSNLRGFWVSIIRPGIQREHFSLSELEYRLLKTLKQYPNRCNEELLIQETWGKVIEKSTFIQRMHHLRKRLREHSAGIEIIENHYGGEYSLNHAEWIQLE